MGGDLSIYHAIFLSVWQALIYFATLSKDILADHFVSPVDRIRRRTNS